MNCPVCQGDQWTEQRSIKDHSISKEEFVVARCQGCGLHVTLNAPNEDSIGRYYQSDVYISHSDTSEGMMDKLYHRVRRSMLARKHKIVGQFTGKNQGQLLDIGSGTGYFPHFMQTKGWSVSGIEVDASTRELSKKRFGLEVYPQQRVYELPEHQYDAITMWHVLEHVSDISGYFSSIYQALKQDGILVIAVPNCGSWDAKKYGTEWAAWDVPRHLWHFQPGQIQQLANNFQFEVAKMLPMPMDAYYVSMLSEKYRGKGLSLLRGTMNGWWSNWQALGKVERSSSVIYILKKQS